MSLFPFFLALSAASLARCCFCSSRLSLLFLAPRLACCAWSPSPSSSLPSSPPPPPPVPRFAAASLAFCATSFFSFSVWNQVRGGRA